MSSTLLRRAALALLLGGCDPDPANTGIDAGTNDVADDAFDATANADVGGRDAVAAADRPDVRDSGVDSGATDVLSARVRSCAELSAYFNCEGDARTCFSADPSGDQGACDQPGLFCENWENCRDPASRRAVDWDCRCNGSGAGARWRCVVEATCASRRDAGRD